MTRLAVDVGQTGLRLRWPAGEHTVAVGGTHLAAPGAVRRLATTLAGAATEAQVSTVDLLLVGVTGWPGPDGGRELARTLGRHLGAAAVIAASDAVTGYLGALGPEPGVVLTAGTGVVAVGARPGQVRIVGGLGWPIDDEGGGFWIGRQGLLAAARSADGRGPATGLLAAAVAEFGPPGDWLARVHAGSPVAVVAGFARQVTRLAAEGDGRAAAILDDGADRLAEVARAADPDPPVVVVTGALAAVPALTGPLTRAFLHCGLPTPAPARGSPLDGADQLDAAAARELFADHIVGWET